VAPQQPNAQRPRRIKMRMQGEKHWTDLQPWVVIANESLKAINHPLFRHRPHAKFPAQHLRLSNFTHLKGNLTVLLEIENTAPPSQDSTCLGGNASSPWTQGLLGALWPSEMRF
jgi:hypothetical protein